MEIKIENYTKKIKKNIVLNGINLTLKSGKVYGLKGKNGCGKTMLMRAISGLISATEGKVIIDNEILGSDISFPRSVGVLIENPSFLPHYTGIKNLKLLSDIRGIIGEKEIEEILIKVGLDPQDRRKYKSYSLGMKQKLGIACALMENPDLIILDEPINALDEESVGKMRKLLEEKKQQGALIIVACHDTEELLLLADEIVYIEDGKVVKQESVDNKRRI